MKNEIIVDVDKLQALKDENARRGLTLATLCDMLLGENAADRSDDALIRRARELLETERIYASLQE